MKRIIDNVRFMVRNPSFITQFIRSGSMVRNAMNKFRRQRENSYCSYCGKRSDIQIHHIIPVSIDDTLADVPENFIALCGKCHFSIAHANNYKSFVPNIQEICNIRQVAISVKHEED